MPADISASQFDLAAVTRRAICNQILWTIGHALTTGGFLLFFVRECGVSGMGITFFLVIPETVGVLALMTRDRIRVFGSRKRLWLTGTILARLIALGIPGLVLLANSNWNLPPILFSSLGSLETRVFLLFAVSQVVQAFSYVAYLSWLSDLADEQHWGRFFGKRNIAKVVALLFVLSYTGVVKLAQMRADTDSSQFDFITELSRTVAEMTFSLNYYISAFWIGTVFQLLSIWPMLRLPDVAASCSHSSETNWRRHVVSAWKNRSLRFLLIHSYWLAFFNGLTQSAFFLYLFSNREQGEIGIGLGIFAFYALKAVMNVAKIPVSAVAGRWCDGRGNKPVLFWSVIGVSFALIFWLAATPKHWQWLIAAYVLWGLYAAVNISGRNLLLKLAPRSDNTTELAMFRQLSGGIAGASGLLGGYFLSTLLEVDVRFYLFSHEFNAYHQLFLISFLGRLAAAFWLLPIGEPVSAVELGESIENRNV